MMQGNDSDIYDILLNFTKILPALIIKGSNIHKF